MTGIRHIEADLKGFDKSFACLSTSDPQKVSRAVIFIHGFYGSARDTWTDFHSLGTVGQAAGEWWDASDLFFYHYRKDSVLSQISHNKLRLWDFLDVVFPTPPQELFEGGGVVLRKGHRYRDLTLVGHSEGGLLIRKIILGAADNDQLIESYMRQATSRGELEPPASGLLCAKLRLFAPALGGASLSGALGVLASLPLISNALRFSSAKSGLFPESPVVSEARNQTQEYASRLTMECFRAHVIWADHDVVVEGEKYWRDLECRNIAKGTTHHSICKPKVDFPLPVFFVERGVQDGKC